MPYTLKTTLTLDVGAGSITELNLVVTYTATKGTPASYADPGSPDEIEVQTVRIVGQDDLLDRDVPGWLDALICDDEALKHSLQEDWQEKLEEAAERRAEDRREAQMMGNR